MWGKERDRVGKVRGEGEREWVDREGRGERKRERVGR